MLNQKGFAHIFLIIVLLAGIVAGVFLVQKTQIFKPKATASAITFINGACVVVKDNKQVLTCTKGITFKLVSPLDTTAVSDKGTNFDIVKTAYAAGSGLNYYCNKEDDPEKIYRKVCDLPFNLCIFPWWSSHLVEASERCDKGQECQVVSQGVFDSGAKCVAAKDSFRQAPIIQQPVFQAEPSGNPFGNPNPQPEFQRNEPPALVPSPAPVEPAAPAEPARAPAVVDTPVPPAAPTPAAVATPAPTPTPTPSPTPAIRTTVKYKFGENPAALEKAKWQDYTQGGVTITDFNFTDNSTAPIYNLFVLFQDDEGNIIKANPYPAQIELVNSAASPTPTASASSASQKSLCTGVSFGSGDDGKKPGDRVALSIVYTGTPGAIKVWMASNNEINKPASSVASWTQVAEKNSSASNIPFTIPSDMVAGTHAVFITLHAATNGDLSDGNIGGVVNAKCATSINIQSSTTAATPTPVPAQPVAAPPAPAVPPSCNVTVDIASWPNCSNQTLVNLPSNLRDMLPNEAIMPFSNGDLLSLFPKARLATLPSSRLESFSNGDLLDIADSTGNRKAFLSNFSCSRIASFALEIQQLVGCAQ